MQIGLWCIVGISQNGWMASYDVGIMSVISSTQPPTWIPPKFHKTARFKKR